LTAFDMVGAQGGVTATFRNLGTRTISGGELLGGYRVDVALKPPIKSAPWHEEGPLIGRDGPAKAQTHRR
jgi:hypothetical protein